MLSPGEFPDVDALSRVWSEHEQKMRAFVDELGENGMARVFEYQTLSGHAGRSVFRDMLQHVVNHASYHRGQVTTMLRQLGVGPARSMDMIAFYREREARAGR
ncbi:MAG: hypothetical protein GEU82_17745 [Luteitalea sp.]|nr:hypothetical protein [Luteitalea sp.]